MRNKTYKKNFERKYMINKCSCLGGGMGGVAITETFK